MHIKRFNAMDKIIIVSRNQGIVSKGELENLANDIKNNVGAEVHFSTPKRLGTQVTFHDVIEFWVLLKTFADTAIGKRIVDTLIELFKDWAKLKLTKEKKKRPKTVTIFGPDGKVLSRVTVKEDGTDEIDIRDENSRWGLPEDSEPFD
jgi:hypothetical protein